MARTRPDVSRYVTVIVVALGAAVLIWASTALTFALALGSRQPEIALRWWPWGTEAQAALAYNVAGDAKASADDLARAERLAIATIWREPVNVEAVRTLATLRARQGRLEEADRLFASAEQLSRRDLPTQLWLIERAVQRSDVPTALKHYDRALRTSRAASDQLLPILAAAADDPELVKPLGDLLKVRPNWWPKFMAVAVKDTRNAPHLLALGRKLKLDAHSPDEIEFVTAILARLIDGGHYGPALAYYGELKRQGAGKAESIRDGGFEGEGGLPPFDWWLSEKSDLSATREVFEAGDTRLVMRSTAGQGGEVARQLLVLPAGSYRIAARVGQIPGGANERPSVAINCVGKAVLLDSRLPQAGEKPIAFADSFVIPASECPAQWLVLRTAAGSDTDAWIDDVQIQRR